MRIEESETDARRASSREGVVILASASPRRRELLLRAGIPHEVRPADIDERPRAGEHPIDMTKRLAREKALWIARQAGDSPRRLVLGSDTTVVLDAVIYGKPSGPDDAVRMLRELTGRTHEVVTAVAVVDSATLEVRDFALTSRVTLRAATNSEIRAYVATGEPLDKAGAYAIQGDGRALVEKLEGSETNVIGLPVAETVALLCEAGLERDPKPSDET